MGGRQRVLERTLAVAAGVALFITHPLVFRAPVHVFFGFPHIGSAAAEAERLQAHRLEGAVAGKHQEVSPRKLAPIFLFDGPKQQTRLVEVGVVGPTVERCEALGPRQATAPSVGDAVGTRTVPGHADEEGAIMAVVGGPPVLRRGHQVVDVLLDGRQIQRFEFLGVVEVFTHRIGQRRVLTQNIQFQLIGPPIAVSGAAPGGFVHSAARERTLGGIVVYFPGYVVVGVA